MKSLQVDFHELLKMEVKMMLNATCSCRLKLLACSFKQNEHTHTQTEVPAFMCACCM